MFENISNEYEQKLDKFVVTYVMLNNKKILINQYQCSDFINLMFLKMSSL